MDNRDGTLSIFGTVLDAASSGTAPAPGSAAAFDEAMLASLGREFAYNDPQAGFGSGEGAANDQNVELLVKDPRRADLELDQDRQPRSRERRRHAHLHAERAQLRPLRRVGGDRHRHAAAERRVRLRDAEPGDLLGGGRDGHLRPGLRGGRRGRHGHDRGHARRWPARSSTRRAWTRNQADDTAAATTRTPRARSCRPCRRIPAAEGRHAAAASRSCRRTSRALPRTARTGRRSTSPSCSPPAQDVRLADGRDRRLQRPADQVRGLRRGPTSCSGDPVRAARRGRRGARRSTSPTCGASPTSPTTPARSRVDSTLRITDRWNALAAGGGTDAATVVDIPFPIPAHVHGDGEIPTIGSTCAVDHDLRRRRARAPSRRASARSGSSASSPSMDGGADGNVSTTPNTVFAAPGRLRSVSARLL